MVRETITSCFKDHVTGSGLCGGHRAAEKVYSSADARDGKCDGELHWC